MAKNNKESNVRPPKGKDVAAVGIGATILAALGWLTGGFSKSNGLDWVRSLAIAIGLALTIRWMFAEPFRIPSGSMEPTLHGDDRMFHGDRVFVNKFIYGPRWPLNQVWIPFTNMRIDYAKHRLWRRNDPHRWDIVVFKAVGEHARHNTLVKRVVGLPGEHIHIANGKVYVNDKPLELAPGMPNIYYTSDDSRMTFGVRPEPEFSVVPKDCYLVLGDNSSQSADGRYFGWLPNENILGRVACIWWPPSRWRDFTGFSKSWWWRTLVSVVGFLLVMRIFFFRLWRDHVQDVNGKEAIHHVLINRWVYGLPVPFTHIRAVTWKQPKRGDLVLYRVAKPGPDQPPMLMGRIAGQPGERVFVESGKLTVNGAPVAESALAQREFASGGNVGPYGRSKGRDYSQIPEGSFFILTESHAPEDHWDSRTVGWISTQDILGKAAANWWPPSRWRG